MSEIDRLKSIVEKLRSEDGCQWDKAQTHASLKPCCIEEAAEVICGINNLEKTGDADNLKEELGDLLLQIMFHAVLAEEELHTAWAEIKRKEKEGKKRQAVHSWVSA